MSNALVKRDKMHSISVSQVWCGSAELTAADQAAGEITTIFEKSCLVSGNVVQTLLGILHYRRDVPAN